MKHAIVIAHPNPASFTASIASTYGQACRAQGYELVIRDLYAMRFDPCLPEEEIPWSPQHAVRADVQTERGLLQDVDVFALFYPIWLNAPPAILKGYLERVFGMGFAYRSTGSGNAPLLTGKKLISFSSSGAPMEWVIQSGAWQAMRTLFDGHFAAVCGLDVVDHIHFGGIVPGIRADSVKTDMKTVERTFAKQFVRQAILPDTSRRRQG